MADASDPVRTLLEQRLAERGLTMAEASRKIGKESTYLFSFLKKGKPKKLAEDARIALARLLELPDDGALKTSAATVAHIEPSNVRTPAITKPIYGQRDVPIRGRAQGGLDGVLQLSNDVIDWVERSPEIAGVKDAYALYVDGDSMLDFSVPHGSIVYVHPYRRPQAGRLCVLVLNSGAAYVKRLARVTQAKIYVEQSNPSKTLEFAAADVAALQLITSVVFP
jgi:phage repressor protein C with HTH and peptisase S24 domain